MATTAEEVPEAFPYVRRTDTRFDKVYPLIEHVRNVSLNLCSIPGFKLSIDEMMDRFRGRSVETYQTKNKSISER